MGDTSISWTDKTWNPVRGCSRVSEGCRNCYAEKVAARFSGPGQAYEGLAVMRKPLERIADFAVPSTEPKGRPRWTGVVRLIPEHLADPIRWKRPRRIFVNSMSDLFHESLSNEQIAAVFGVMAAAPQHTFQVLTKRAKRMREWFETPGIADLVEMFRQVALAGRIEEYFAPERTVDIGGWPGYAVTSKGRVISSRKGGDRELKPQANEQGHARVQLYHPDGHDERVLVHRLVLSAFDRSAKEGEQGCHVTGDATNNALWNLRWGTQSDNWDDSKLHGTRRRYSKLSPEQVVEVRELGAQGVSGAEIGRRFGISDTQARNILKGKQWAPEEQMAWPLPSVWLGVSVENQEAADERIPELLDTPAAVRFLSCEPLLGKVLLDDGQHGFLTCTSTQDGPDGEYCCNSFTINGNHFRGIDWVIAGCESGHGARSCDVNWIRSLRDQCAAAGVPIFVKQAQYRDGECTLTNLRPVPLIQGRLGEVIPIIGVGPGSREKSRGVIELPYLDGVQWKEFPRG